MSMCRQGLVFGRAYRQGKVVKSSTSGVGFAIAPHTDEDGELWLSAPAFLHVVGSGFGLSVGEPGTRMALHVHHVRIALLPLPPRPP